MDRHQLLEQKRQRLEELRSRKKPENDHKPPKKDFAIQKDWEVPPVVTLNERITIDKAVQIGPENENTEKSDKIEGEDDQNKELVQQKSPEDQKYSHFHTNEATSPHLHNWSVINATLRDAIRDLGKLSIPQPPRDYASAPKMMSIPTNKFQKLSTTFHGTPTAMAKSSINGLLAVAYSRKAVVYSTEPQLFPEYYLESSSPITAILFDSETPSRIIGGLKSGSVVVWDLENQISKAVAHLPSIRSPMFPIAPSIKHKHTFLHHKSAVCGLVYRHGSEFASISHDGVVNAWSSHILAAPHRDSIQLDNSVQKVFPRIGLKSSDALINDWVILHESGSVFVNGTRLQDSGSCRLTDAFISNNLFIASGLDWAIHMWHLDLGKTFRVVNSDILIYSMSQRPGFQHQFIAIGISISGEIFLQLWDLDEAKPIFQMLVAEYGDLPRLPTFQTSELQVLFLTEKDIVVGTDNLCLWRLYNV